MCEGFRGPIAAHRPIGGVPKGNVGGQYTFSTATLVCVFGRWYMYAVSMKTVSTLHFSIYIAALHTGSVGTVPIVRFSSETTNIPTSPLSRVLYAVKVYPDGNAFGSSTEHLIPSLPGEWCLFSKDSTKMGRTVFSAEPEVNAFALSLMCVLVPLHTSTGTAYYNILAVATPMVTGIYGGIE